MTKKQQNYQLRLVAIAVVFAAIAVLFTRYLNTANQAGVVFGVAAER